MCFVYNKKLVFIALYLKKVMKQTLLMFDPLPMCDQNKGALLITQRRRHCIFFY